MIQQFIDSFYFYSLELAVLAICFVLLIIYKNKALQLLNIREYKSQQRLHKDEVPRFGGIIIYFFFLSVLVSGYNNELFNLLILSFLPMAFLTIKEDLHYEISPVIRISFMIFSCLIFTLLIPGKFPTIDIPIIGKWLEFYPIQIIFYIFSMMVIINGNNLIDGVNGNMTITNIFQLTALCLFSMKINDIEFLKLCILFLLPLLLFLPFNFPMGKIFIGDTGAYLFGFLISGLIIYFFGKYNEFLSWNAIILLFYPSCELLFSFVRKKLIDRTSPFNADSKHLHSIIYKYLNRKNENINNSITVIYLAPFISASFIAVLFFNSLLYLFLSLILLVVFYIFMYVYYFNKA